MQGTLGKISVHILGRYAFGLLAIIRGTLSFAIQWLVMVLDTGSVVALELHIAGSQL